MSQRDVIDDIGLAVVDLTSAGVVTGYNAVARRLCGWTGQNGVNQSFSDHVVENPDATDDEMFLSLLGAGRPWVGRVSSPGHVQGSAPATAVPVRDSEGRLVGGVAFSLELDSALWPLITGSPDGWVVVHSSGRIAYTSRHATRLLGGTPQEIGQLAVTSPHQDGAERLGSLLARRSVDADETTEFVVGDAAEGTWVEATRAGTNADGPLAGMLWRLRDSSGRRRYDGRQRARTAELQRALDTRVVIEQAKGFLSGRDGESPEDAFRRLRRHARDHNLELREVARQLMTGEITLRPTA